MKMTKIVLLSALVSCALISGCKDDKPSNVTIEFMHSSVEQERQAVITKLIEKFEKENPTITVKQIPVEEDAYNTKVITLARTGALPEVIEVSHDYAKVMDKEQLLDRDAIGEAIKAVGEDTFYDGILRVVRTEDGTAWTGVPVSAWLSGVWYHKDILAAAGIEEPHNWEQLLQASQKLNDPHSSDDGIHAAATGAIWSGVIQGFAGVQIVEGELHLAPKLPAHWRKLSFPLRWRNVQMRFSFEDDALTVESSAPVTLTLWGKTLNVSGLQVFARTEFLTPSNGTATTEGRYDA